MHTPYYLVAFFTGLTASAHCLGMCGGLIGALSLSPEGRRGGLPFQLLYHAGRITTYSLIGLAVGWLGSAMAYTGTFKVTTRYLLVASDLFVIAVGLGTAGLWSRLNVMRLEFPGPVASVSRAVRRLSPLPPAVSALPLGLLLGFLPCGILYAMFITAAQSASPVAGAVTMLAFGLGTAPALLAFGGAAQWLGGSTRNWLLRSTGLLVALLGAINLVRHLKMMGVLG